MTVNISGARALAMSAVALPLGWLISLDGASTMEHYRSLTHEALLQDLATNAESGVSAGIAGAVVFVVGVTIAVDVLTYFFAAIWSRIGPVRDSAPQSGAA